MTNISSTPKIDLLLIQDKRFKHLANFIDPRSPSEGIIRSPIVIRSTDISSIVNTPRILEEDLLGEDPDDDAFQTFEEALSKLSFDDCIEEDSPQRWVETHFDYCPLKPMTTLDPRSPTVGIDRTPLVFAPAESRLPTNLPLAESNVDGRLVEGEGALKGEEDSRDEEKGKKAKEIIVKEEFSNVETTTTNDKDAEVFVELGHVIYGTPVPLASDADPQQVRTPLSCLANRKRINLIEEVQLMKNHKSPMSLKQNPNNLAKESSNNNQIKMKKSTTNNRFEIAPRKLIR